MGWHPRLFAKAPYTCFLLQSRSTLPPRCSLCLKLCLLLVMTTCLTLTRNPSSLCDAVRGRVGPVLCVSIVLLAQEIVHIGIGVSLPRKIPTYSGKASANIICVSLENIFLGHFKSKKLFGDRILCLAELGYLSTSFYLCIGSFFWKKRSE